MGHKYSTRSGDNGGGTLSFTNANYSRGEDDDADERWHGEAERELGLRGQIPGELPGDGSGVSAANGGNVGGSSGAAQQFPKLGTFVDPSAFFARGREYEPVSVNHRYTEAERGVLRSYESLDYYPPDSAIYREWVERQRGGGGKMGDRDKWVVMALIGFVVGLIGFLLHQTIDLIAKTKWEFARELVRKDLFLAWCWIFGYSLAFLLPATLVVVYLRPSAAGSGMPELIGYLNGTLVRHIFNVKTLAVKFVSSACAVGSGMPVGPEGPMIHMGALVGAGISQFGSKTVGFALPFFQRFRNSQDKRDFISAGAAAGVASAFGAPVGGLLFAMEEVSSHWSLRLSWQVFFCCMVSTFTTDILDSSFEGFMWEGSFGQFQTDRYILFNVADGKGIDMNVLALIPSAFIGLMGGVFGALFVFCNLKIVRTRRAMLARLENERAKNILRVLEPVVILMIVCQVAALLPDIFPCTDFECSAPSDERTSREDLKAYGNCSAALEGNVELYSCPYERSTEGGEVKIKGSYSQAATLWFGTGESSIHHLFSRDTHLELNYLPLTMTLLFYFGLACWAAGSNISSGLVVPMLLIGGLIGRITGKLMVDLFGVHSDPYWNWMDPGAMAMVGAVAFFGGVTRLTMSLTVIMIEMTNDIQFLLLFMTAVMCAKWSGDYLTHPLYHALLELKCIPFLEAEPVVVAASPGGGGERRLNLDLCTVSQVMSRPVRTLGVVDKASKIAKLLLETTHGAFPVVSGEGEEGRLLGLVSRPELTLALLLLSRERESRDTYAPKLTFPEVSEFVSHKRTQENNKDIRESLEKCCQVQDGADASVDLSRLLNRSAVSVDEQHSLSRTYVLFRTLGLRHLVVTGAAPRGEQVMVKGILTRKDLMGFAMEDRILGNAAENLTEIRQEA